MDINRAIDFFRHTCVCNGCVNYCKYWDCDNNNNQYSYYECCSENKDDDSCECYKKEIALNAIQNHITQLRYKQFKLLFPDNIYKIELTWNDVIKMDGKPVWYEYDNNGNIALSKLEGWGILDIVNNNTIILVCKEQRIAIEKDNKHWKFYYRQL